MSLMQITIYVLIGIGVIGCILALIWTKIIKPNKFGYSNKNIFVKKEFNDLVKKLNSQAKIKYYENLSLNLNQRKPIFIERMIVTVQNAYLITNPLENKVMDVELKNNQIKMVYKNKLLDLPLDVNIALASAKVLKNKIEKQNLKIVIPVTNSLFIDKVLQNIHFVQNDNLFDYINKLDNEASEFNFQDFIDFIEKNKLKTKPKRSLFGLKKS